MYLFAYITADLIMTAIWLGLFFRRKDLQQEMLVMSGLSLFWIVLSFPLFIPDWYAVYHAPETLMPLMPGLSDFWGRSSDILTRQSK